MLKSKYDEIFKHLFQGLFYKEPGTPIPDDEESFSIEEIEKKLQELEI